MPSYYTENNQARPSDDPQRSLQKINDIVGATGLNAMQVSLATKLDSVNDSISTTPLQKQSYSVAFAVTPAATPTDVVEIVGSASKTVRVKRVIVTATATSAGTFLIQLIKRSAADSGGTSTTPTISPHDSNNNAATAVVRLVLPLREQNVHKSGWRRSRPPLPGIQHV